MATFASFTLNGNLTNDPVCKEFDNGGAVWNFTLALNAKDKESKEDATIWVKFSYKVSSSDEFMLGLKKKSCVMVVAKFPYVLNQYSASYTHEKGKHDMNLALEVVGITRGTFDSKKPEGEESASVSAKEDNLVPADKGDFKIPGEGRPKF